MSAFGKFRKHKAKGFKLDQRAPNHFRQGRSGKAKTTIAGMKELPNMGNRMKENYQITQ